MFVSWELGGEFQWYSGQFFVSERIVEIQQTKILASASDEQDQMLDFDETSGIARMELILSAGR
jgi:hypothetical protein